MKRLLCILLSFVVFTACEDDKDTLPYPMNELDGTYWEFAKDEYFYYDENGALIKHIVPDWHVETTPYFFKGNSLFVIDFSGNSIDDEYLYSIYWKDRKLIMRNSVYDLVEYNDSYFVRAYKGLGSFSEVPGCSSYLVKELWLRKDPPHSLEYYMEHSNYTKHY